MSFAVLILAAGGSSRLGQPKQLVKINGKSLIAKSVETAIQSQPDQIVVVLGAQAEAVRAELAGLDVTFVENPHWNLGMGGSISVGIASVNPGIEECIVMLCDQPLLTPAHLSQLIQHQLTSGAEIVASAYDGVAGVPACFASALFPVLSQLNGDIGAREVIRSGRYEVAIVPFAAGSVDIDTPIDIPAG
jgi:molybdenum cofactor cytidylyltransferase